MRASPLFSTTKRAPDNFAAVSKSICRALRPVRNAASARTHNCASPRSDDARRCRARPCPSGTSGSERQVRDRGKRVDQLLRELLRLRLQRRHLLLQSIRPRPSARAPPPRPCSSWRRRSPWRPRCAAPAPASDFWIAPRRCSSIAIRFARTSSRQARAGQAPASNAAALSRIHLMSCMAGSRNRAPLYSFQARRTLLFPLSRKRERGNRLCRSFAHHFKSSHELANAAPPGLAAGAGRASCGPSKQRGMERRDGAPVLRSPLVAAACSARAPRLAALHGGSFRSRATLSSACRADVSRPSRQEVRRDLAGGSPGRPVTGMPARAREPRSCPTQAMPRDERPSASRTVARYKSLVGNYCQEAGLSSSRRKRGPISFGYRPHRSARGYGFPRSRGMTAEVTGQARP